MSTLFDPRSILSAPISQELATKRDPLPAGETYGQITKLNVSMGTISKGENTGKPWMKLDAVINIEDPAYLEQARREKASITYGVMLDLNATGGIAMGPNLNVRLGKLREATGTNQPGMSMEAMQGKFVKLMIGHRPDESDSSIVYDEVKGVAKYG